MLIQNGTVNKVHSKLADLQDRDSRGGNADTHPAKGRVQYETRQGDSFTTTQAVFSLDSEGSGYYDERILKNGKVVHLETGSINRGQACAGESIYNAEISTHKNQGDDVWLSSFEQQENFATSPSPSDNYDIETAMESFGDFKQ